MRGWRRVRLLTAAGGPTAEDWTQAAARLLREHPDVTGVVAWSEWAAWGAARAAAEGGRTVPGDLSIVCLGQGAAGDLLPLDPTRVDLRHEQLAAAAVTLLLEALDAAEDGERQVLLQPELIAGATTAPPREA